MFIETPERLRILQIINDSVLKQKPVNHQKVQHYTVPFNLVSGWLNRFGTVEQVLGPCQLILGRGEKPLKVSRVKYNPANGKPMITTDGILKREKVFWPPHDRVLVSLSAKIKPGPQWWIDLKDPQCIEWKTWLVLPFKGMDDFIEIGHSSHGLVVTRYAQPVQPADYSGMLAILEGLS